MRRYRRITRRTIDPAEVLAAVKDDAAGGAVLFLGTIRNRSDGKRVTGLDYEVYKVMAEKKMLEIEARAKRRWPVVKMAAVHRYGALEVGEVSVAVAVACEHRSDAFQACRYTIDSIKRSLPIWKKETFRGGAETWVKGTRIRA